MNILAGMIGGGIGIGIGRAFIFPTVIPLIPDTMPRVKLFVADALVATVGTVGYLMGATAFGRLPKGTTAKALKV